MPKSVKRELNRMRITRELGPKAAKRSVNSMPNKRTQGIKADDMRRRRR